jgi:hypothetical protein
MSPCTENSENTSKVEMSPLFKKLLEKVYFEKDDEEEDKKKDAPFDPETFDEDLTKFLFDDTTGGNNHGCMECGKSNSFLTNSFLTCAACKWSVYCSKECQRKHWKANHRAVCNDFRDNRKDGCDYPECFRAAGLISDDNYLFYTELRWKLFLQSKIAQFSIATSVIYLMREVRHVVSISYYNEDKDEIQVIDRFIMKPVDSGGDAIARIQHGSGSLSEEALIKVKNNLLEFIGEARSKGKRIIGITCGRGIVDLPDDAEFNHRLKEIEPGSMLVPAMLAPSSDFVMQNLY